MSDAEKDKAFDEVVEGLRKTHGDVWVHQCEDDKVVFRRPTSLEFKAFRTSQDDESKNKFDVSDVFAAKIVVYPGKAGWDALTQKYAGIAEVIAVEGARAARGQKTAFAKKASPPSSESAT